MSDWLLVLGAAAIVTQAVLSIWGFFLIGRIEMALSILRFRVAEMETIIFERKDLQ